MKKTYKSIRVSEETYQLLMSYRAELEAINNSRISFDEAIEIMMGENAGLDHEITSELLRFRTAQDQCSCGACAAVAPPVAYQFERLDGEGS